MVRKHNLTLIPKITATPRSLNLQFSAFPRQSSLANLNLKGIRSRPKGGRKLNPLGYSMKMLQQQQKSALQFRTQAMQTQQRFRNLEQQRQLTQSLLDSMRQQRELQRKQQMDWMEEGIRMREAEAQQRRQRLMEQLRQPISIPEPFKPVILYEPTISVKPPEVKGSNPIPKPQFESINEIVRQGSGRYEPPTSVEPPELFEPPEPPEPPPGWGGF